MYVDKNALIIEGENMGEYLTQVEFGYNKMWAGDSGRNLKAVMSGTFLGVIVKLKLTFKPLNQTELEKIAPILDSAFQTTSYYDPVLKAMNSIQTYTGDWSTLNKNIFTNVARANESFTISVIATAPRESVN